MGVDAAPLIPAKPDESTGKHHGRLGGKSHSKANTLPPGGLRICRGGNFQLVDIKIQLQVDVTLQREQCRHTGCCTVATNRALATQSHAIVLKQALPRRSVWISE